MISHDIDHPVEESPRFTNNQNIGSTLVYGCRGEMSNRAESYAKAESPTR